MCTDHMYQELANGMNPSSGLTVKGANYRNEDPHLRISLSLWKSTTSSMPMFGPSGFVTRLTTAIWLLSLSHFLSKKPSTLNSRPMWMNTSIGHKPVHFVIRKSLAFPYLRAPFLTVSPSLADSIGGWGPTDLNCSPSENLIIVFWIHF